MITLENTGGMRAGSVTVLLIFTCVLTHHPLPSPPLLGDGNFHVLLMLRPGDKGDVDEAHRLAGDIALRAIEMGGTCTGEHG
jgi:hypothetical protein